VDTGSLVVVLGVVVLALGISLIRRGSSGAANDPGSPDEDVDLDE
jgi:hypothetical protein